MALRVGELYATLKLNDKDFQQALGKSKAGFEGLKSVIGKGVQATANAFAGTTLAVTGLGLAALKVGLDYNRMQQSSRAALSTLLGGAEAANAQMDKLDDFARNSPFAKQVFIQAQQQLLGFGVAAENVIPTLDAVQNAVAAVGGSNEQVSQVTYALAQMQGQGKLTGETLNQLGQYGIDAATILGKEMGKTGAEIRDLASKPGGIPVDEVFKPLTDGLMKRFGGATDNIKQQMDGAADRIKGAFRDIGSALAMPFVDPKGGGMAVEWTNKVADAMRALETKIKPLVTLLQDRFQPQLDLITPTLDKVRGAINSWDISKVNGQLDRLTAYSPLIASVAAGFFAMGTNVPVLASLGLTLNPVVAALGALALTSPQVQTAFMGILTAMQPLLPVLGALGMQLADVLMHAIEALAPAMGDLAVGFTTAGVSLVEGFAPALVSLLTAATPLIDVVAQLATFVGDLPTPILAAALAMVAFSGPVGDVVKVLGGAAASAFKSFGESMEASRAVADAMGRPVGAIGTVAMTARAGVESLGTALKTAFLTNAVGLAIAGVTAALGYFISKNAEAKERVRELTGIIDENTGAWSANAREIMHSQLEAAGAFELARTAGIDFADVIDAALDPTSEAAKRLASDLETTSEKFNQMNDSDEGYVENMDRLTALQGLTKEVGLSAESAAGQQQQYADKLASGAISQDAAKDAVDRHTRALEGNLDIQREATDATLSAAEATLRAKESQDRAAEATQKYTELKKSGKASTDELMKSEQGAEAAILASVRGFHSQTDAMKRNNSSAKDLDAVIKVQRETFIKQRMAMGDSEDAAKQLADSYGLIPDRVQTEVIAKTLDAQEAVNSFIKTNTGKVIRMTVSATGRVSYNTGGAMSYEADGSVRIPSYANGKMPDQAIIKAATPGLIQWAEPETEGEAFIPLAPSKRKRSIDIWEETGKRLGQFPVRQFANGSFDGQSSRPLAPSVVSNSLQGRMLSDADVRAIADAVREGAAGGVREGMDDAGGGISTLVRAGHGQ